MYRNNDDGAYAVLVHIFDPNGDLVDLVPSPILGFELDDETGLVRAAVTLRGVFPTESLPIWTPDGAVIKGENVWPSPQEYLKWAEKRVI